MPTFPIMRSELKFNWCACLVPIGLSVHRVLTIRPENPEISVWNQMVIFRKNLSEIVEYLQRHSSFSVRNGTAETSLPFAKLFSFQSLISGKQLHEIELQKVRKRHFVRLVCWFWKIPYHYSTLVPTSLFWQMVMNPPSTYNNNNKLKHGRHDGWKLQIPLKI